MGGGQTTIISYIKIHTVISEPHMVGIFEATFRQSCHTATWGSQQRVSFQPTDARAQGTLFRQELPETQGPRTPVLLAQEVAEAVWTQQYILSL